MNKEHIVIVGAGLVGTLLACLLAKRGYTIDLYERRSDPRAKGWIGGRSINLALSNRGLKALELANMADEVRKQVIPMHGRMIHDTSNDLRFQAYGKEGQFINSVSRGGLNIQLLERADAYENVQVHFGWRCEDVDFDNGVIHFQHVDNQDKRTIHPDLIVGSDGAFSAVRTAMQKSDRFNYSQQYIPHGYKELTIAPTPSGGFQMEPNALHIWPRKQYMLIALPNADGSFTCTLFLAFEGSPSFAALTDKASVVEFFHTQFPDIVSLIPDFAEQFMANPSASLVTVRCAPWVKNNALLIGDAAHAIVPFYGQGMNAGFEDCTVLMQLLDKHDGNWQKAIHEFEQVRVADANAVADLALRNFVEMRDLVSEPSFILRKRIEAKLHEAMPDKWLPLYSMVTFSEIPYSEALALGNKQDAIMAQVMATGDIAQWENEAVFRKICQQVARLLEE